MTTDTSCTDFTIIKVASVADLDTGIFVLFTPETGGKKVLGVIVGKHYVHPRSVDVLNEDRCTCIEEKDFEAHGLQRFGGRDFYDSYGKPLERLAREYHSVLAGLYGVRKEIREAIRWLGGPEL